MDGLSCSRRVRDPGMLLQILVLCVSPARQDLAPCAGGFGVPKEPPHPWNAAANPQPVVFKHRVGIGMGGKGPFQQRTLGANRISVPLSASCGLFPSWSLQEVIPEGCAAAAPRGDTNMRSDGKDGEKAAWECPAPPRDLLLGSSSSPCRGNDPAGTWMELCSPALGSWLPPGTQG